jgi:hypothetical protein
MRDKLPGQSQLNIGAADEQINFIPLAMNLLYISLMPGMFIFAYVDLKHWYYGLAWAIMAIPLAILRIRERRKASDRQFVVTSIADEGLWMADDKTRWCVPWGDILSVVFYVQKYVRSNPSLYLIFEVRGAEKKYETLLLPDKLFLGTFALDPSIKPEDYSYFMNIKRRAINARFRTESSDGPSALVV